jgi:hypothetical protein
LKGARNLFRLNISQPGAPEFPIRASPSIASRLSPGANSYPPITIYVEAE